MLHLLYEEEDLNLIWEKIGTVPSVLILSVTVESSNSQINLGASGNITIILEPDRNRSESVKSAVKILE